MEQFKKWSAIIVLLITVTVTIALLIGQYWWTAAFMLFSGLVLAPVVLAGPDVITEHPLLAVLLIAGTAAGVIGAFTQAEFYNQKLVSAYMFVANDATLNRCTTSPPGFDKVLTNLRNSCLRKETTAKLDAVRDFFKAAYLPYWAAFADTAYTTTRGSGVNQCARDFQNALAQCDDAFPTVDAGARAELLKAAR